MATTSVSLTRFRHMGHSMPAHVCRDEARLEGSSWHVAQKTCEQSRSTAVAASRTSKQMGHSSESESESAAAPSGGAPGGACAWARSFELEVSL